jgi:predicted DNA-binding WGR domain protein
MGVEVRAVVHQGTTLVSIAGKIGCTAGDRPATREWGRLGSPGRIAAESFAGEEEARRAEQQAIRLPARHGYSQVSA